jgi:hypothetical protein
MKAAPNAFRCGITEWHLEHATSYWWLKIGIAVPGVGRQLSSNTSTAMAKGTQDLSIPQVIIRQAYFSFTVNLSW